MVEETKKPGSYQAPALEKGLEILEFLADKAAPFAMMEIANALQRSRNEIYRMLVVLERRGYIVRLPDERYELTNHLFALSMRMPPRRNLHDAALPAMHRLSETLFQSCHLVVTTGNEMVVVARVESPDQLGFAVRVGYRRPILLSTSGRLLFAFLPAAQQAAWLKQLRNETPGDSDLARFETDCAKIVAKGFHIGPSAFVDAITDLGAPIFDGVTEGAAASLIVPFVSGRSARSTIDEAVIELRSAAASISETLQHG